jgi:hypothetical protein
MSPQAKLIMITVFNSLQVLGLWTFAYHYFNTAISAEQIIKEGISHYECSLKSSRTR